MVQQQIAGYIALQPERKRDDLQRLHDLMQRVAPNCRLWFLDGTDETGRIVSNPSIGYGSHARQYADGSIREFYQIGISANTTGISVYIMGLSDKTYLRTTYGDTLGKASITGYCIKFRALSGIDITMLEAAIRDGLSGGT